jgi:hypothetical protein
VAAVCGPQDSLPAYDAQAPVIALAGALGITAHSIPAAVPYLATAPTRRAEVATALSASARRLKVGLAWSGSRQNSNDRRRSIALATLSPLLTVPGVAWYSLQRSDDETEIPLVPAAAALQRLPARNDFDGTAAPSINSISSSAPTRACASGRRARAARVDPAAHASDWRWQQERVDSPYLTVRLFRQPRRGDWSAVIARVGDALAALAARAAAG